MDIQEKKMIAPIQVPKLIHQTWKTKNLSEIDTKSCVYMNSWRQKNPEWEYKLYDDLDCRNFIKAYHPDALKVYDLLPKKVEKADFFRYLAILSFGGIYADIDCACAKPIETWMNNKDGMVVGVELMISENEREKLPKGYPNQLFCQWTFAARPNHPILHNLKNIIIDNIENEMKPMGMSDLDTLKRTGPVPFTQAIMNFLKENNTKVEDFYSGGRCGDLTILSSESFGLWAENASAESCVLHGYHGTWRNK